MDRWSLHPRVQGKANLLATVLMQTSDSGGDYVKRGMRHLGGNNGWVFIRDDQEVWDNFEELIELARQDSFAEVEKMIQSEQAEKEQSEPA